MLGTSIPRLVAGMSLPMIIAMTVNGLYYLVDAAFIGNTVGMNGVAALAVGFPIDMFFVALATMCSIGTAGILSIELGKRDVKRATIVLKSAILFVIIATLIITVFGLLFKDWLLFGLGANEAIYPHANAYYSIIISGAVTVLLSFLGTNAIRAEGNAGFAAIGMIMGALLNIALDAVFILSWGWGTAGAAWGTVIARVFTIMMYIVYYGAGKSLIPINKGVWRIDFNEVARMMKVGFAAFTNQIGFSALAIMANLSIKQYGNVLDFSIFGLVSRILVFITMPLTGIGQGVQSVIGFNYGAGKTERLKSIVNMGYLYSTLFGALLFVLLFFFPRVTLSLFTESQELINMAVEPLRITTVAVILIGVQIVSYFYFIGINHTRNSVITSICRQAFFIAPLILVLPLFYGIKGLWYAFPISDGIAALFCMVLVRFSVRRQV